MVEKYKKDLKDIQSGNHIGFKNAIQLAELEYEDAIKRADLFYKYQLDCAQHVYQTEYEQTLLDYKVINHLVLGSKEQTGVALVLIADSLELCLFLIHHIKLV